MGLRIKAGARLDQFTFHNAFFASGTHHRLTVDLSACIFVDCYSLVELVTLMTVAARREWIVKCRLPTAKGRDTYLARMHFFDALPEQVVYDRPPPSVEDRASSLVHLTKLDLEAGEAGVQRLAEWVHPQLPDHLSEEFTQALAEIGSNVVAHSEAEVGFVVGQRYERDFLAQKAPRLHLVVGDAGVGIKESLCAALPALADEPEEVAIFQARQWYVTGKPETHSGVGLSTVLEYTQLFDGRLRIRSGGATVVSRRGKDQVKRLPGIHGTVVSVELASPGRQD